MRRSEFIKKISILSSSLMLPPYILRAFWEDNIGINLPGSHYVISDLSNSIDKNTDKGQYFYSAANKIINNVPAQKPIFEKAINGFKNYPKSSRRNGFDGVRYISGDINKAMTDHGKMAITPAFKHHSGWTSFDDSHLCDSSIKTIGDDNSVAVKPIDGRPDQTTYIVDDALAHLILNPKWYCIGLPSSYPEIFGIDQNMKRDIYNKTGKETNRSVYKLQQFSFYGTSICGAGGMKDGPINRSVYYDVDEAITQFFDLTDIVGCGDPKELKCKLKI